MASLAAAKEVPRVQRDRTTMKPRSLWYQVDNMTEIRYEDMIRSWKGQIRRHISSHEQRFPERFQKSNQTSDRQ